MTTPMPKLTLPLVVGKKYVRRDGHVVELTKVLNDLSYPFQYTTAGGIIGNLTEDGRWGFVEDHPYDLVADYIEPAKPKGHRHAALMALYAQDAAECAAPWTRWERRQADQPWCPCARHPNWRSSTQYRRKPKTIRIGEFDVPEPMREAPPLGTTVFVADPSI